MPPTPDSDDNRLIELAASCRFSPRRWSRLAWDWGVGELAGHDGPRGWQDDINDIIGRHLENPATRYQPLQISVASGHGIGKSAEMGMLSNWAMSCFADCRIVTTANTEGQLRTKTAPEIGKWFRMSITAHWFDIQTMSIKSRDPRRGESWRQDFIPWSEHNTEAFAGLHNKGKIILLLFDEASKIHDRVWEVAEGALTDEDTVIIWVVFGNPTRNSGRFRECFRRFRHRWIGRQIDSRTIPGTNKQFLQRMVDDHGEDSDYVKVRVRGQFPSQSAMQFISADDVDKARAVHLRNAQYGFAPVIIGVDPSWTGDDPTVIMLRQGLFSRRLASIPRNDNDIEVANLIARFEDDYQADAVFVDAGYGTGIVSAGTTMGRSWQLVWFGSTRTLDPGFYNMRSYIWGQMKRWIKAGGAIDPRNETLYQDLVGPETVARIDGKIQLESKQDMKERGIPSPNEGDALALTFTQPVTRKLRTRKAVTLPDGTTVYEPGVMRADTEYDPLGG